jgi:hypothetical protein
MHPDAQLSRKITFGTNGASGGITLTQLRKVSRGMGGERLTPEPEELPESKDKPFKKSFGAGNKRERDGTKENEWQDEDEFAVERNGNTVGEVGKPHNYVGQVEENEAPEVEELPASVEDTQTADKEERKKAKKAKRKAEQKEKEAKRLKGAED